jgi:hypothetical protein
MIQKNNSTSIKTPEQFLVQFRCWAILFSIFFYYFASAFILSKFFSAGQFTGDYWLKEGANKVVTFISSTLQLKPFWYIVFAVILSPWVSARQFFIRIKRKNIKLINAYLYVSYVIAIIAGFSLFNQSVNIKWESIFNTGLISLSLLSNMFLVISIFYCKEENSSGLNSSHKFTHLLSSLFWLIIFAVFELNNSPSYFGQLGLFITLSCSLSCLFDAFIQEEENTRFCSFIALFVSSFILLVINNFLSPVFYHQWLLNGVGIISVSTILALTLILLDIVSDDAQAILTDWIWKNEAFEKIYSFNFPRLKLRLLEGDRSISGYGVISSFANIVSGIVIKIINIFVRTINIITNLIVFGIEICLKVSLIISRFLYNLFAYLIVYFFHVIVLLPNLLWKSIVTISDVTQFLLRFLYLPIFLLITSSLLLFTLAGYIGTYFFTDDIRLSILIIIWV